MADTWVVAEGLSRPELRLWCAYADVSSAGAGQAHRAGATRPREGGDDGASTHPSASSAPPLPERWAGLEFTTTSPPPRTDAAAGGGDSASDPGVLQDGAAVDGGLGGPDAAGAAHARAAGGGGGKGKGRMVLLAPFKSAVLLETLDSCSRAPEAPTSAAAAAAPMPAAAAPLAAGPFAAPTAVAGGGTDVATIEGGEEGLAGAPTQDMVQVHDAAAFDAAPRTIETTLQSGDREEGGAPAASDDGQESVGDAAEAANGAGADETARDCYSDQPKEAPRRDSSGIAPQEERARAHTIEMDAATAAALRVTEGVLQPTVSPVAAAGTDGTAPRATVPWSPAAPPSSSSSVRCVSTACVETSTNSVLFAGLVVALEKALTALVQPFTPDGTCMTVTPAIRVTVLAQTDPKLQPLRAVSVLLQNALATPATVPALIDTVKQTLHEVEHTLAKTGGPAPKPPPLPPAFFSGDARGEVVIQPVQRRLKRDHVFVESIQNGIFAMSRMPSSHTAVLVVITDGVVSFPNSATLHASVQALIRTDVACSFIQVGKLQNVSSCTLGNVPDTELLHFIATSTGGSFIMAEHLPDVQKVASVDDNAETVESNGGGVLPGGKNADPVPRPFNRPNMCHVALLLIVAEQGEEHRGIFPGKDAMRRHVAQQVLSTVPTVLDAYVDVGAESALKFPYGMCEPLPVAVIRRKWKTYKVHCGLMQVLAARLKAGFWTTSTLAARASARHSVFENEFSRSEQTKHLEVILSLPLVQHIQVECILSCSLAPPSSSSGGIDPQPQQLVTKVRLEIVAPHKVHKILSKLQKSNVELPPEEDHASPSPYDGDAALLLDSLKALMLSDSQLVRLVAYTSNLAALQHVPEELRQHTLSMADAAITSSNGGATANSVGADADDGASEAVNGEESNDDEQQLPTISKYLSEQWELLGKEGTMRPETAFFVSFWESVLSLHPQSLSEIMQTHILSAILGSADDEAGSNPAMASDEDATESPASSPLSSVGGDDSFATLGLNTSSSTASLYGEGPDDVDDEATRSANDRAAAAAAAEEAALLAFNQVLDRLADISTFALSESTYIRLLETTWMSGETEAFCMIKITRLDRLVNLWIGFFNVCYSDRVAVLDMVRDTVLVSSGDNKDAVDAKQSTRITSCQLLESNVATIIADAEKSMSKSMALSVRAHINSYGSQTRYVWDLSGTLYLGAEVGNDKNDSQGCATPEFISARLGAMRESEGFTLVLRSNGDLTYIKEFAMVDESVQGSDGTCLVCYSILPSTNNDGAPAITEIWMDPQYGHTIASTSNEPKTASDVNTGMTAHAIVERIVTVDKQFISAVCTFQYLQSLSNTQMERGQEFEDGIVSAPIKTSPNLFANFNGLSTATESLPVLSTDGAMVQDMPFDLDLTSIMSCAKRMDVTFPGFSSELVMQQVVIRAKGKVGAASDLSTSASNADRMSSSASNFAASRTSENGDSGADGASGSDTVYKSTADFRQDIFVHLLRAACDIEVPLDETSCKAITKYMDRQAHGDQPDSSSGKRNSRDNESELQRYHCFATTFDDRIILTVVGAPLLNSEQTSSSHDAKPFGKTVVPTKDVEEPSSDGNDKANAPETGVANDDCCTWVSIFECTKEDLSMVRQRHPASEASVPTFEAGASTNNRCSVWDLSDQQLCDIADTSPSIAVSETLHTHLTVLIGLYIRSFVGSVFRCVQLNLAVTDEDVNNALEVCTPEDTEINLTALIQRLSAERKAGTVASGLDASDYRADIQARFRAVLGLQFQKIPIENKVWYLTPPASLITTSAVDVRGKGDPAPSDSHSLQASATASKEESVKSTSELLSPTSATLNVGFELNFGLFQETVGLSSQMDDDSDDGSDNAGGEIDDEENGNDAFSEPMFMTIECTLRRQAKGGAPLFVEQPIDNIPLSLYDIVANADSDLVDALESGAVSIIMHVSVHTFVEDDVDWEDDDNGDDDKDKDAIDADKDNVNSDDDGAGGGDASSDDDGDDDAIASLLLLPGIAGTPNRSRAASPQLGMSGSQRRTSLTGLDDEFGASKSMSAEHLATFAELTNGIAWLVEDEMIALQRADDGISVDHLQRCIKHLKVPPVVTSSSAIERLDLHFVEDAGYDMFARELTFDDLQGYVMEEVADLFADSSSFYIRPADGQTVASLASVVPLADQEEVPDVWVAEKFTMPSLFDDEESAAKAALAEQSVRLPFTLSLRVTQKQVELFFHCRGVNLTFERAVLEAVKELVVRARARVNELLLLEEVDNTQICNPALVVGVVDDVDNDDVDDANAANDDDKTPPLSELGAAVGTASGVDQTTPADAAAAKADADAAANMKWYAASGAALHNRLVCYPSGAFACRMVFTRDFILHRRLPASKALLRITETLAHLTVANRENQFVYRQQSTKDVFLLQFTIIETGNSEQQVELDKLTFDRPPDRIRLEVYGVRRVGEAIGRDLIEMMSNLIDSAAVSVLSERLAKIAKLRLTAADLEFLTSNSSNGEPNTRVVLPLPAAVLKSTVFMEYFKQHLRQYLLPYMGLAEKEKEKAGTSTAPTSTSTANTPAAAASSPSRLPFKPGTPGNRKRLDSERELSAPVVLQHIDFDFIYSYGAAAKSVRQQRLKARSRPTRARRVERETAVRDQVTAAVGRGIALISAQIKPGVLADATIPEGNAADEWAAVLKSISATLDEWSSPDRESKSPQGSFSRANRNATEPSSSYIDISVWLRGGLQLHALVKRVVHSAKQALCEYALEMFVVNASLTIANPLGGVNQQPILSVDVLNQAIEVCCLMNKNTPLDSASLRTNTFQLQASCNDEFMTALPDLIHSLHPSLDPLCFHGILPGAADASYGNAPQKSADVAGGCETIESELYELLPLEKVSSELRAQSSGLPTFGRRTQGVGSTHGKPIVYIGSNIAAWSGRPPEYGEKRSESPVPGAQQAMMFEPVVTEEVNAEEGPSNNSLASHPSAADEAGSTALSESSETAPSADSHEHASPTEQQQFKSEPLSTTTMEVAPRHAFAIMIIHRGMVRTVSYNLGAQIVSTKFHSAVANQVQWTNSRNRFLSRMLHRKMGLYHHAPVGEKAKADSVELRRESMSELRLMIGCAVTPTEKQVQNIQSAANMNASSGQVGKDDLITMSEGACPEYAMHGTAYANEPDPVRRHGLQLQEMAVVGKHTSRADTGLALMQHAWRLEQKRAERAGGSTAAHVLDIEEVLDVKRAMRPHHYCATPVMFNPNLALDASPSAVISPKPSRPSSVSEASGSNNAIDVSQLASSRLVAHKLTGEPTSPSWEEVHTNVTIEDERWHNTLLNSFRELYVKYAVEHLGFSQVYSTSSRISDGFERGNDAKADEDGANGNDSDKPHSVTTFLQYQRGFRKGGGIILLEVGSSGAFACCKLHVMNASRDDVAAGDDLLNSTLLNPMPSESMLLNSSVNEDDDPELNQELFTQDCTKFKDFMHANSFGYDFNVHTLTAILSGKRAPGPSFDFMRIFKYLLRVFPSPPAYGHNVIHRRKLNLRDMAYFSNNRSRSRGASFSRGRSSSNAKMPPSREASDSSTASNPDVMSDGASNSRKGGNLLAGHENMSLRQIVLEYLQKDFGADGSSTLKTFGDKAAGHRRLLYRCNDQSSGGEGITVSILLPLEELKEHPERITTQDQYSLSYYVVKCDNRNRFPRMTLPLQQHRVLKDVLEDNRRLGFSHLIRPAGFEPQATPFLHLAEETGQWLAECVDRALMHYRRDVLWDQMLCGSAALGNAGVTADELSELLSLACVSSFEASDDALRGLFALPFTWARIVDAILGTFGQNTRFIPVAQSGNDTSQSNSSGSAGGDIIQVVVFDAEYTDVAAHLRYNPQTSKLKADLVSRQDGAATAAAVALAKKAASASEDDGIGGGNGGGGAGGDDDEEGEETAEQTLVERRHMAAVINMICCNLWGNL